MDFNKDQGSKINPRSSTLAKSGNGRKWRPKTIPQKKKKKKSKYKPSDESLRVLRSVDIIFAPNHNKSVRTSSSAVLSIIRSKDNEDRNEM